MPHPVPYLPYLPYLPDPPYLPYLPTAEPAYIVDIATDPVSTLSAS